MSPDHHHSASAWLDPASLMDLVVEESSVSPWPPAGWLTARSDAWYTVRMSGIPLHDEESGACEESMAVEAWSPLRAMYYSEL